jgi:hypothetical protein
MVKNFQGVNTYYFSSSFLIFQILKVTKNNFIECLSLEPKIFHDVNQLFHSMYRMSKKIVNSLIASKQSFGAVYIFLSYISSLFQTKIFIVFFRWNKILWKWKIVGYTKEEENSSYLCFYNISMFISLN